MSLYRVFFKPDQFRTFMLSVIFCGYDIGHVAFCRWYAGCRYAECRYAECRYAECGGAL